MEKEAYMMPTGAKKTVFKSKSVKGDREEVQVTNTAPESCKKSKYGTILTNGQLYSFVLGCFLFGSLRNLEY